MTRMEELEKQRKMRAALEMVLLFHSIGPWALEKKMEWDNLAIVAFGGERVPQDFCEATTRNLCNAVRKALE